MHVLEWPGSLLKISGSIQDLLNPKLGRWDLIIGRCNKSPGDLGACWGLRTIALSVLYLDECYPSVLLYKPSCSDHSCKSLQMYLSPLYYRSQVVGFREQVCNTNVVVATLASWFPIWDWQPFKNREREVLKGPILKKNQSNKPKRKRIINTCIMLYD